MIDLEQDLQREIRMKNRKIKKFDMQLNDTKDCFNDLTDCIYGLLKPHNLKKLSKDQLVKKIKEEL